MKPIIFLALLVVVFSSFDEELVVQLKTQSHLPLLQTFLSTKGFSSSQIISYFDGKASTPASIELSRYFLLELDLPDKEKEFMRKNLLKLPFVTAAFIKPQFVNAEFIDSNKNIKEQDTKQTQTPNYLERQTYREASPRGVNIDAVKNIPGSDGNGITVFDVEQGFNFLHEDLIQHNGSVIVGRPFEGSRHHGAAVCGVVSGYQNGFGVTGISHKSKIYGCSFHDSGSRHPRVGPTISKCSEFAKKGDIILLEMHAIGPSGKFIAMTWWPDNAASIKYATEQGKIVVAAGGNGGEDLDKPIFNRPLEGFPPEWRNPFNRSLSDCGAIVVGAGAPPPGTHGRNHGADRSRLDFSNYGSTIDAQGYGREVTTIGYGDLFNQGPNRLYTDTFSGTSSASPVVTGAIASVQGMLKAKGKPLLDSKQFRDLLRSTGSPQQDERSRPVSQRIGNRPNILEMIQRIGK